MDSATGKEDAMIGIVRCLSEFAQRYGHLRVRENGYSHLLFSHLRQEYGNVFMTGVGITLDDLQGHMGEAQEELVAKYMRKSKDLYPDLVMFPHRILDMELEEISRFNHLPSEAQPRLLVEWKFTSSFPTMPRRKVIADAAKLELLGHYLYQEQGHRPELLQVIFNFPAPGHKRPDHRFHEWYQQEELPLEVPHVKPVMVFDDGRTETLGEWCR